MFFMKISSRLDYALSCILRIADRYNEKRIVSIKEICEKERLEFDYVEKLLISMKRGGILKSIRGRSGGYVLAFPPDRISVKDVVIAVEKDVLELVCFRKGRRRRCVHLDDCKVRRFWFGLKEVIGSFLEKHTLRQLLDLRRKEKNWALGGRLYDN